MLLRKQQRQKIQHQKGGTTILDNSFPFLSGRNSLCKANFVQKGSIIKRIYQKLQLIKIKLKLCKYM